MIAEVIIDSNVKTLNKTFDYLVPTSFEKEAKVGARVLVPFGNRKELKTGYIISIKDSNKVELAILMARKYFCNISDCMKLMLPPRSSSETELKKR